MKEITTFLSQPHIAYAYGVCMRQTLASSYRYVGIASFCHEPTEGQIIVVGGFLVRVERFDNDGFMYVTSGDGVTSML